MDYSGAEWMKKNYKYAHPEAVFSDLGCAVADLLGELFYGIYHIDNRALMKVDWTNKSYIEISIGWQDWSTVDFDNLTRLVFLAHHQALRVNLTPVKYGYMRLLFHQRTRSGGSWQRCPRLEDAYSKFFASCSLVEVVDKEENN